MEHHEENRITYRMAMGTCLSGLIAQGMLRAWGYEGPANALLGVSILATFFVNLLAFLSLWEDEPCEEARKEQANAGPVAHRLARERKAMRAAARQKMAMARIAVPRNGRALWPH